MHIPSYRVPSWLQFTEHFISHVTVDLIEQKSNKRALYWTVRPFYSSFLYLNTTINIFLTVNQVVRHSDSTLGTFGRKSIVPSACVPRA